VKYPSISTFLAIAVFAFAPTAVAQHANAERDILVTFDNAGARMTTSRAPYRTRKRYAMTTEARKQARAVEDEYHLEQVDHWPIRSLSVYCFVYRVADGEDREQVLDRLRADVRVESAQALNQFETGMNASTGYDDAYAGLQYGLDTLELTLAHRYSRGEGVRIAVIDSSADTDHEDLEGRIASVRDFSGDRNAPDQHHGTAVTSVIGASANNAKGIVGIAPEASIELYIACWSEPGAETAVCDSFTLAKALDSLLEKPPQVLNLSLVGPADPLLERLLLKAHEQAVVLVAARPAERSVRRAFPAMMDEVIDVGSSAPGTADAGLSLYAPGEQIIVALPGNEYDFRSGSSLAAAHVSGIVALLLSVSPDTDTSTITSLLERSQQRSQPGEGAGPVSVNACKALQLADGSLTCGI
jgi:subtilisin family serine protease